MRGYSFGAPKRALASAVLCSAFISSPVLAGFTITDLGDSLGGSQSSAAAINASGQVAGTAYTSASDFVPFLYSSGSMLNVGSLGGFDGNANGVNAGSQVVGSSYLNSTDGQSAVRAFLYNGTQMQNLGLLAGDNFSVARGINDNGEVVGGSYTAQGNPHAFLYSGGQMKSIGTLGGTLSLARAINDNGVIVGNSTTTGDQQVHAFLYNGTMHDLNPVGVTSSDAYAINASGEVAGVVGNNEDVYQGFFYNGTTVVNIGTLGGSESYAYGINDSAQVVGMSEYTGGSNSTLDHAFLYANGAMIDLNTLISPTSGWTLVSATAINDNGQIAGTGINPSGQTDGFLLNPVVPEPASASLLFLSGAGLLIRRRRSTFTSGISKA